MSMKEKAFSEGNAPLITGGAILLSAADVARTLGLSEPTIWRLVHRRPDFPRPFRITGRCTRWRRSDVEQWAASLGAPSEAVAAEEAA